MRLKGIMSETDKVIRAMTNDGAFRIIAARTSATARGVISAQDLATPVAKDMADLVTAAVLYRETMAPTLRVQCIIRLDDESGRLVADSHPDGWSRGLVQAAAPESPPDIRASTATLEMMRTLPNSELHRGVVQVPESGNLSDAFMRYMQLSEQIVSMVALGSVVDGDSVAAGGYLVQLLPEAAEAEAAVETMSERLADFVDIRDRLSDSPEALVEQIFDGMPFTWLHESEVRFGCQCSQLRVMTTLSLLERSEIQELVDEGEPLSIGCDYCGASYTVEIAQLQGLLSAS
jgi:molecular chaperone Hsp33